MPSDKPVLTLAFITMLQEVALKRNWGIYDKLIRLHFKLYFGRTVENIYDCNPRAKEIILLAKRHAKMVLSAWYADTIGRNRNVRLRQLEQAFLNNLDLEATI